MRRNRGTSIICPFADSIRMEWIASYLVPDFLCQSMCGGCLLVGHTIYLWLNILTKNLSFAISYVLCAYFWRCRLTARWQLVCVRYDDNVYIIILLLLCRRFVAATRFSVSRIRQHIDDLFILRSSPFASSPSSMSLYCCRPIEMISYDGSDRIGWTTLTLEQIFLVNNFAKGNSYFHKSLLFTEFDFESQRAQFQFAKCQRTRERSRDQYEISIQHPPFNAFTVIDITY